MGRAVTVVAAAAWLAASSAFVPPPNRPATRQAYAPAVRVKSFGPNRQEPAPDSGDPFDPFGAFGELYGALGSKAEEWAGSFRSGAAFAMSKKAELEGRAGKSKSRSRSRSRPAGATAATPPASFQLRVEELEERLAELAKELEREDGEDGEGGDGTASSSPPPSSRSRSGGQAMAGAGLLGGAGRSDGAADAAAGPTAASPRLGAPPPGPPTPPPTSNKTRLTVPFVPALVANRSRAIVAVGASYRAAADADARSLAKEGRQAWDEWRAQYALVQRKRRLLESVQNPRIYFDEAVVECAAEVFARDIGEEVLASWRVPRWQRLLLVPAKPRLDLSLPGADGQKVCDLLKNGQTRDGYNPRLQGWDAYAAWNWRTARVPLRAAAAGYRDAWAKTPGKPLRRSKARAAVVGMRAVYVQLGMRHDVLDELLKYLPQVMITE